MLRAGYRHLSGLWEELPFLWAVAVLTLGGLGGTELANALGGEQGSLRIGNILLFAATILACMTAALYAITLLRRRLPPDHGGTAT